MASGYYRLLNSLKARAKKIFKDRARKATPEEADAMLGPKESMADIIQEKEMKKFRK